MRRYTVHGPLRRHYCCLRLTLRGRVYPWKTHRIEEYLCFGDHIPSKGGRSLSVLPRRGNIPGLNGPDVLHLRLPPLIRPPLNLSRLQLWRLAVKDVDQLHSELK